MFCEYFGIYCAANHGIFCSEGVYSMWICNQIDINLGSCFVIMQTLFKN